MTADQPPDRWDGEEQRSLSGASPAGSTSTPASIAAVSRSAGADVVWRSGTVASM